VTDPVDDKKLIGPYIKAETFEEAEKIAFEYELGLIGELHELITDENDPRITLH
jgi:hypothetical protein